MPLKSAIYLGNRWSSYKERFLNRYLEFNYKQYKCMQINEDLNLEDWKKSTKTGIKCGHNFSHGYYRKH